MPEEGNNRVTLAVVQNEVVHLRRDVEQMHRDMCAKIQTGDDRIVEMLKDHEERLRHLEGSQPWNIWRDLGTFLTAIGAAIASVLKN